MIHAREIRARVLDALERAVKQFRTREALYPLRVPRDPVAFDEIIAQALGDDRSGFDPRALRSRTSSRYSGGRTIMSTRRPSLESGGSSRSTS